MKKIKKLESRYNNIDTSIYSTEEKEYLVISNGHFDRCLLASDNVTINSLDFEGGPMIHKGDTIEDVGEVTNIKHCYLITVK